MCIFLGAVLYNRSQAYINFKQTSKHKPTPVPKASGKHLNNAKLKRETRESLSTICMLEPRITSRGLIILRNRYKSLAHIMQTNYLSLWITLLCTAYNYFMSQAKPRMEWTPSYGVSYVFKLQLLTQSTEIIQLTIDNIGLTVKNGGIIIICNVIWRIYITCCSFKILVPCTEERWIGWR